MSAPNFNDDEIIFLDDLAPWIAKEWGVTLAMAENLAREVIKEATKRGQLIDVIPSAGNH